MTKQELKKEYIATIRTWKGFNPKTGRGIRINRRDKVVAVGLAKSAAKIGETSESTAKRLGITPYTLSRWTRQFPGATIDSVTPPAHIHLSKPQPKGAVELILANGTKVTGITAAEAVSLLKALA